MMTKEKPISACCLASLCTALEPSVPDLCKHKTQNPRDFNSSCGLKETTANMDTRHNSTHRCLRMFVLSVARCFLHQMIGSFRVIFQRVKLIANCGGAQVTLEHFARFQYVVWQICNSKDMTFSRDRFKRSSWNFATKLLNWSNMPHQQHLAVPFCAF